MTQNGQQFGRQNDPNAILNGCREIDRGIDEIEASLGQLASLHKASLNEVNSSQQIKREIDSLNANIMNLFRNFTGRLKSIKQQPDSGAPRNAPQVGRVGRRLRETQKSYNTIDAAYRDQLRDQMARQYRIVRPDASDAEVNKAVESPSDEPIFSQAMMQSDRRGHVRTVMSAVESRHEAIQKINQQMIELAELFQEMDNLVMQQDAAVTNIEMKGEEVVENMDKGTEQIGVAIQSARNARKWKWWCLGICGTSQNPFFYHLFLLLIISISLMEFSPVLIIVIIVVVILIYKFVIQNNGTTKAKRFVLPELSSHPVISDKPWTPSEKLVVPGLEWSGEDPNTLVSKAVVPGQDWTTPSGKWKAFSA